MRLAAAGVNFGPPLAPVFPFVGLLVENRLSGLGALPIVLAFLAWSGLAGVVVLIVNARLILVRQKTLGLAAFGLVIDCESPRRVLLVEAGALAFPLIAGTLAALSSDGADSQFWAATGVPLGLYALGWAPWLWPSRRTLADRLGACSVVRHGAPDVSRRSIWLDVFLLGPLLLLLPLSLDVRGAAIGTFIGLLLMALLAFFSRRAVASAE
jgi:hypothetical protein